MRMTNNEIRIKQSSNAVAGVIRNTKYEILQLEVA